MTYLYKANNPGFEIYLRKDIPMEDGKILPPFTDVAPMSGAYLPWFNFETREWEETADEAWVRSLDVPEATQDELLARLEVLLEEAESIKQQLT